jgi:hypothetical protein
MTRVYSIDKAAHIIGMIRKGKLSLGEVQAHTTLEMTKKFGSRYNSPIALVDQKIRGTGVPASTLKKFVSGSITPRERSINKLAAYYDRLQSLRLKQMGANDLSRKNALKLPPKKTEAVISKFRKASILVHKQRLKSLSKKERIPKLYEIRHGLSHSRIDQFELIYKLHYEGRKR